MNAVIETIHLRSSPLAAAKLPGLLADEATWGREMGIQVPPDSVPPPLAAALQERILPHLTGDPAQDIWRTLWPLLLRDAPVMAGNFCFKGPPDAAGHVEIGAGIHPDYRNRGLITEAIEGICTWLRTQPGLRALIAETVPDNAASQRVLAKAGFRNLPRPGSENLWWIREI